jgi:hypothetical protein
VQMCEGNVSVLDLGFSVRLSGPCLRPANGLGADGIARFVIHGRLCVGFHRSAE